MSRLINKTRNNLAVEALEIADSPIARMRGLLGRSGLPAGAGLLIMHCNAIHMFFMRFSIDAVFLDASMRVVEIAADLHPWRMASCRKARHTLELPAGLAASRGIAVGDELQIVDSAAGSGEQAVSTLPSSQ